MKFSQEILEELLLDPVMAAKVIMGVELDVFQKARLRYLWGVPTVIDSSGVSSGKTIVNFIYLNLRCILLPNHVAAIYFPTQATGIDEFWPYFARFIESAPIYRSMLTVHRGRVGESKQGGTYVMNFKNHSRLMMPAPNFMQDSKTQASRRFNTLVVDEWLEAETMGDGTSKQLVQRVTRESFNQNHPIWANHIKFFAHAERPEHKGYKNRYVPYREAIRDGSTRHALISFCYKDWSPAFAKRFLVMERVRDDKRTMSRDEFCRVWLGIWTRDGDSYYPLLVLGKSLRTALVPRFGRELDGDVNILGVDVSQSTGAKADWCATYNLRIREVRPEFAHTFEIGMRMFELAFTYGHLFKNVGAPEVAGFIHLLHRVFGFSLIVLDSQGGGLSIYRELKRPEQVIQNVHEKATPLCTPDDAAMSGERQPIVRFFNRAHLGQIYEPQYLTGSEGLVAAAHRDFRAGWEGMQFHWPQQEHDRTRAEMAAWDATTRQAQKAMDIAFSQLLNIRVLTDKNGNPLTSSKGFLLFDAKGKKDAAYAAMYAYSGAMLWFKEFVAGGGGDDDDEY